MAGATKGKVITVRGEIEPEAMGSVLMHEHLHFDCRSWQEVPTDTDRMQLLMTYAVPNLIGLHQFGCHTLVDATPMPWRAWPDTYSKIAEVANLNLVLSTGFYREMETGSYWVESPEEAIWPAVRTKTVEELAEICIHEIVDGLHGSNVRAGIIKLGSTTKDLTAAEHKAFRAGAIAQKATGVSITTHCTSVGAHVSQLELLSQLGVDLTRVVIGHTAKHLVYETESVCDWMRQGATFLPTNLRMDQDWEFWMDFVVAIQNLFQIGLGNHIVLGLDWAFDSQQGPFLPCTFMPPPPFRYMFTHTLPRFRKLGLIEAEIEHMMVKNPGRILPVQ